MDFESLFRRQYPPLYRYLNRLTGDADAADDIAQEAFVRLLGRNMDEDGARRWLFTVATNLVREGGRTTARRRRILEAVPVAPEPLPRPDEVAEQAALAAGVRAALDHLSERDRAMLLMREQGFSYAEIAHVAEVAPGSVGTLLARALRRFAEVYRTSGGEG